MKPQFENASKSFKTLNPHLFGVGGLPAPVAKQNTSCALDGGGPGSEASKEGVGPRYRVTITVYRRRLLDSDNSIGGLKPLRDEIAIWLRSDDSDRLIQWEYHQLKTQQRPGTAVKIERL